MVDGTGTTTYTVACPEERGDELGRLLSVTSPATPSNKTVAFRYDRYPVLRNERATARS